MAQGRRSRTISVTTDLSAFNEMIRDVVSASRDAVTPAAEAGAKIVYDATYHATPVSDKGHWFTGYNYKDRAGKKGTGKRYWFNSGNLRRSLYSVLSADNTGPGVTTYHVSWNYTKAPYAYMVHNGTSKAAANPFVVIGRDRSMVAAQDAMANKFFELMRQRGLMS